MSAKVIARMTVTREVGATMIIEIQDDATFHTFYRIYSQQGKRRSTKTQVRTANRNEGLSPWYAAYRMEPGLNVLAENWKKHPGVKSVKVRIIRKKIYRNLCTVAADQLGITNVNMTLSEKRAAAGRKGGNRNVKRHGKRWMKKIGKWGAHVMHSTYKLEPTDLNDFALVHRQTGEIKAYLSGKLVTKQEKA